MSRARARFVMVNVVSMLRIPLGALFLFCYIDTTPELHLASFALIIAAVLTDFADGALARRFGVATKFGYLVDGITDRAAYVAVLLGIGARNGFPLLLAYVLIVRDFLLYGVRSYYPRWIEQLPLQRTVAHIHAGALRAVLGAYLLADALLSLHVPFHGVPANVMRWMPLVTFLITCASYYSLWLVMREQSRFHGATPFDELQE